MFSKHVSLPISTLTAIMMAAIGGSVVTLGCSSSPKKAEIAANANPNEEMASLESDIQAGYQNQYDILAAKEFTAAQNGREQTKTLMKNSANQERLIDSLAIARGHLNAAKQIAETHQAQVQGILDARTAALNAGARNYPREQTMLGRIDDDFRSQVNREMINPVEFADLQKRYLNLELRAVQAAQLGGARAAVAQARNNGAPKNTPMTLNKAENALTNAENFIAANRNNEGDFHTAVEQAKNQAAYLAAVLAASKRPGGEVVSEDTAISIVAQNKKIAGLNEKLESASQEASAKDRVIGSKDEALADKDRKLAQASEVLSLDQALEEGRKQFSNNEADVSRKGDKLLIRLKALQFSNGRVDLPATAAELLAKVRTVASSLNPTQVVVQGHTDSVGSPQANLELSQKRAEAVAQYLAHNGIEQDTVESVGYGFKMPLASNKTKLGRAQNRRVDILITPAAAGSATAQ